ncbi:MAG: Gfo/Idh/MocA family oxidoreductase [Planctomycetes bacterium]|nr:Gfo/Idh/MocA family oxidoreductase [Planctomycetota bacterium]
MEPLRFALAGAGFWSSFQLAAWGEIPGVRCVAICDRDRSKAEALAAARGVPRCYTDAEEMLDREKPELLDIVTDARSHGPLVRLAARRKIAVICQKPMAATLEECEELTALCRAEKLPFAIHENCRWQAPLRRVKELIRAGAIGTPHRCRIDMISGFDVFANQPGLRAEERMILADLGCHLFDLARSWFGEADRVYCRTLRVRPDIKGEDTATALLTMGGTIVTVNMAYAGTPLERECFPETLVFVEGDRGSLEVLPSCRIRIVTRQGTEDLHVPPPAYAWADPKYAVVQSSMVPCLNDLARSLRAGSPAETDASDNLKTMKLVFAAYESAAGGRALRISE